VDLLLVDGDGLAYYCAGKDGTPAEKAYSWVSEMVGTFAAMTQAKDVRILLTAEASPKGGRYAVAWEQMLQGDSADFIPGLPLLYGKKCGEVSARRFMDGAYAVPGEDPMGHVRSAYGNLYKDEGDDRFLEQACLLWMRRRPIDPLDMARSGGPLEHFDNEDALERLRKRATGED
jgi:hypothetical protein